MRRSPKYSVQKVYFVTFEFKPFSSSSGHATPQQPIRPSFMDYFDKQDNKAAQQQESYNHNQAQEQQGYHIQSKNVFPDNWKVPQDGDFDFVSVIRDSVVVLFIVEMFTAAKQKQL